MNPFALWSWRAEGTKEAIIRVTARLCLCCRLLCSSAFIAQVKLMPREKEKGHNHNDVEMDDTIET